MPRSRLMLLLLPFCVCTFSGFCAPINTSYYSIEEQGKVTDPFLLTSWLSVLHLHESGIRIPLMPEESPAETGFSIDRETLRVEWLVPDQILWISWNTVPGPEPLAFVFSTHIITQISGSSVNELLRRGFIVAAGLGSDNCMAATVNFTTVEASQPETLQFKKTVTYDFAHSGLRKKDPLTVVNQAGVRVRHVRLIEESCYKYAQFHSLIEYRSYRIDLSAPPLFQQDIPAYSTRKITLDELADFWARIQTDLSYLTGFEFPSAWKGHWSGQTKSPKAPTAMKVIPVPKQNPRTEQSIRDTFIFGNPGIETLESLTGLVRWPCEKISDYDMLDATPDARAAVYWERQLRHPAQWLEQADPDTTIPLQLTGAIGDDLGIVMDLRFTGNQIHGAYWYQMDNASFQISGQKTDDNIFLEERNEEGKLTGNFSGTFVSPVEIEGVWSSPDGHKTFPFFLVFFSRPISSNPRKLPEIPPGELDYELRRREIPAKDLDCTNYQYELVFPGQDQAIELGPLCERDCYTIGFDKSSLKLKRLNDSLLQVTWETLPAGSGIFSNWCTLLLQRTDKGWQTIFSDAINAAHSGGVSDVNIESLHFETRPEKGLVLLKKSSNYYSGFNSFYDGIHIASLEEWPCEIAGNRLEISKGRKYLVIDEKKGIILWKLARIAYCTESEPEQMITTLRSLNPSLNKSNVCSGVLLLNEDHAPYMPHPEGIHLHYGGV